MRSLAGIKENRYLCTVVTSLRTYDNMLLTGIMALQDETCPEGWTGTLTFTHLNSMEAGSGHVNDQSSTPVVSGSSAVKKVGAQSGSVLQTILKEAGIALGK